MRMDAGSIPGLSQWVKDPRVSLSCGVGHRCGSDLALLWLGRRPAATALIQPLAWEPPYAVSATLKRPKKKKKKKNSPKYGYTSEYVVSVPDHCSIAKSQSRNIFGFPVHMKVRFK